MNKKMFVTDHAIYTRDTVKNRELYTREYDYCKEELLEVEVVKECRVYVHILTPEGFGEPHVLKIRKFKFERDRNDNYCIWSSWSCVFESKLQYYQCQLANCLMDIRFNAWSAVSHMDPNGFMRQIDPEKDEDFWIRCQARRLADLRKEAGNIKALYTQYMREKKNPS